MLENRGYNTFSPLGAEPGEVPGSPFFPWQEKNTKKDFVQMKITQLHSSDFYLWK